jgi:uncharacterized membrane protein YkoI
MKINRFIALAAIALLIVGAMGFISVKVLARSSSAPAAQTQSCDQQDNDAAEVQDAADTDNVDVQCGDQNGPDEQGADGAKTQGVEDGQVAPAVIPALPAAQVQNIAAVAQPGAVIQTCDQQDDDAAEAQDAADTDNIEDQCGDQNGPDEPGAGDVETESAEDAEVAPASTPVITAEQAQAAALAVHPGTVIQTELGNENGQLVYSVEFEGGVEVKVDAMTGAILGVESGQD